MKERFIVDRILSIAGQFLEAGCEEITLADTTGMANPTCANLEKLIETAYWIEQQIGRRLDGMIMKAGL